MPLAFTRGEVGANQPGSNRGLMPPFHPDRFTVDATKPFERDRLDRQVRVEALCEMVERVDTSAVIAVNGPFGSGKTVFVTMCAAHLRSHDVDVVEFNAWQQSHTRQPLIDLVAALGSDAMTTKSLRDVAVNLLWRAGTVATRGILAQEDFRESEDGGKLDEWKQVDGKRAEFRTELSNLVAGASGKLVLVVDELDRCIPRHALDLLDVVRHLFDVPGVVVVLGINQAELCQRIKSVFGPGCEADIYLRRFVDLTIDLPHPDTKQLATFVDQSFDGAGLRDRSGTSTYSADVVKIVAARSEMSLRDIEQMVHRLAQVLAVVAPTRPDQFGWCDFEQMAVAVFALRVVDRASYDLFGARQRRCPQEPTRCRAPLPSVEHCARTCRRPSDTCL